MTRTLIIHAHPSPSHSVVTQALRRVLTAADDTTLRSLYELYPDFDIDVSAEQAALLQADLVIWLTPVYWYSVPALMKHWFDQVLSHGWAYGHGAHALRGKHAWWVTSAGGAEADYAPGRSHRRPFEELAVPVIEHVARYCHMEWLPPYVAHGGHHNTAEDLGRHSQALGNALAQHRRALSAAPTGAAV